MTRTPMIATYVTRPLPALGEAAAGSRALAAIFSLAEVPDLAPEAVGLFMPQRSLLALLEATARVLGVRELGLLYGPRLDVADWGAWGAYVRDAISLEGALRRSGRAMRYHVSMDTLHCETRGGEALFVHRAALAGCIGYRHYAACAASAMISLVRAFTGPTWSPTRVEIDLPRPRHPGPWEDLFRCPVRFDRPDLAVVLPRDQLTAPRLAAATRPTVTTADLRRLIAGGVPRDFVAEVAEIARLRLLDGRADIDGLARQIALGPRTLQRRLGAAGTNYRNVVARVRAERALELLRETASPIADISAELGYSTASHFARAFRREVGRPPSEIRRGNEAASLSPPA